MGRCLSIVGWRSLLRRLWGGESLPYCVMSRSWKSLRSKVGSCKMIRHRHRAFSRSERHSKPGRRLSSDNGDIYLPLALTGYGFSDCILKTTFIDWISTYWTSPTPRWIRVSQSILTAAIHPSLKMSSTIQFLHEPSNTMPLAACTERSKHHDTWVWSLHSPLAPRTHQPSAEGTDAHARTMTNTLLNWLFTEI